ncbi:nucleoside hydrolase-like domain-containing protein [Sphingobium fuliginis]|uniref:nucleoside hydrolase-like domain-containing protein n=1 Tax=Sphingobium fuliginis (strain ATCC 27551) TaxID=336203 RepID=UPI001FCBA4F6|nr:nucleoside hydrolase-like domain-containing protein [Sphingobium fuliginis]
MLSDIETDPDDTQSLIRLFLYASQIYIDGLVATASTHMTTVIHPDSIRRIVEACGKVQANLALHDAGYPTAAGLALKSAEYRHPVVFIPVRASRRV